MVDTLAVAQSSTDLAYLDSVAREVIDASRVSAAGGISGGPKNETGYDLHVPGGTQNYYPAFWIRDAAMMLGGNFIAGKEVEGWIRLTLACQAGPSALTFPHGLIVPPYSIPDHITLNGEACWYPGAYADQGDGHFGILPPADDAFFFVQMAYEQVRLSGNLSFLRTEIGGKTVFESVCNAFASVEADEPNGIVKCDDTQTRVDWGFCDSIRKTGLCLMPSLLRFRAAVQLSRLAQSLKNANTFKRYRDEAQHIAVSISKEFLQRGANGEDWLISATGVGRQEDIWGESFALTLGVVPRKIEIAISKRLCRLYREGKITALGQVRHLVTGEYWQQSLSSRNSYQNGGYWGTGSGWLAVAMSKSEPAMADRLIHEYAEFLRSTRKDGSPFEWINPTTNQYVNGNYASSAGLVSITLKQTK